MSSRLINFLKVISIVVSCYLFFIVKINAASYSPVDYGRYLGKTVDNVVRTIHATEPKSFINHADILALMCVEQRSLNIANSSAASRAAGAKGLTQVTENTYAAYLKSNKHGFASFVARTKCTVDKLSTDPRCSIEAGARIFDDLLVRFNGDRNMAAGAYHGGIGAVISKNQYKGPLTTKYATQLFPACHDKIIHNRAPAGLQIWRALIDEVSRLTGKTLGLDGIHAKVVPYLAGTTTLTQGYVQNQQPQSFWQHYFGSWFNAKQQEAYINNNSVKANNVLENSGSNLGGRLVYNQKTNSVTPANYFFNNVDNFSVLDNESSTKEGLYIQENKNQKTSTVLLKCFPNILIKNEPFLLMYSCPSNTDKIILDEEVLTDKASVKLYHMQKTENHKLSCKTPNKEYKLSCAVKLTEPRIENFSISPANPQNGDLVTVKWSAKDVSVCNLFADSRLLKHSAVNSETNFVYNNTVERLDLICTDKFGHKIKQSISL